MLNRVLISRLAFDNTDNQRRLASCGAVVTLKRILDYYVTDIWVCRSGCAAIYRMVLENVDNQNLFVSHGVVPVLVKVMDAHILDVSVCRITCATLYWLARCDQHYSLCLEDSRGMEDFENEVCEILIRVR